MQLCLVVVAKHIGATSRMIVGKEMGAQSKARCLITETKAKNFFFVGRGVRGPET